MKHIYFHKETGHYQVGKKIEGKQYSFGTYSTIEEAIKVRDYFKENNWPIHERLKFSKTRFIQKTSAGNYMVVKQNKYGEKRSFGVFKSLKEAEHQVRLCVRFNWDKRLKPFDCMKYIRKRTSSTGKVTYRIIRWTSKGEIFYVTFNNLEVAQFERDFLVLSGWDYDIMEHLIDESFGGTKFLEGKYCKKSFIYNSPNGQIDYGMI